MNELDSIYLMSEKRLGGGARRARPAPPERLLRHQRVVGASFQSRDEAITAVHDGMDRNVLWGSDYPHVEGTWAGGVDDAESPMTHRALRRTFAGLDGDEIRRMVGENAVGALGLDRAEMRRVADRIGAPSVADVSVPLDELPPDGGLLAFRTFGPWA